MYKYSYSYSYTEQFIHLYRKQFNRVVWGVAILAAEYENILLKYADHKPASAACMLHDDWLHCS